MAKRKPESSDTFYDYDDEDEPPPRQNRVFTLVEDCDEEAARGHRLDQFKEVDQCDTKYCTPAPSKRSSSTSAMSLRYPDTAPIDHSEDRDQR